MEGEAVDSSHGKDGCKGMQSRRGPTSVCSTSFSAPPFSSLPFPSLPAHLLLDERSIVLKPGLDKAAIDHLCRREQSAGEVEGRGEVEGEIQGKQGE